jgi:leader peptidase (prepilin peptidase)/N-methyltransferase
MKAALTFVIVTALLAAVSWWRARSCGDAFAPRILGLFALVIGVLLVSLHVEVALPALVAVAGLAVCAASDLASGYVYDAILVPAACAIFALECMTGTAVGAMEGCALSTALALAIRVASRNGLGFGDVKLFGLTGLTFGMVQGAKVVGAAFVAGAAVCVPLLLARRIVRGAKLPFAPFIAVSAVAAAIGAMPL